MARDLEWIETMANDPREEEKEFFFFFFLIATRRENFHPPRTGGKKLGWETNERIDGW